MEKVTFYLHVTPKEVAFILTFFLGTNYYFYLSNVQNNIQMLNFYTDLNAIFIKIYMHIILQLFETYQNNY